MTSKSDLGSSRSRGSIHSSVRSSGTHRSVSSRVPSSIANDSQSQKGVFFLISRKVTLAYGPYVVQGVLDYRIERLEGLIRALRKAGGEVMLKPSYHLNEVRVWHLEQKIFSCKITDLQHGGDGDLDRRCGDAGHALEASSRKAHYNLKHRYRIQGNFESPCPCHPKIRSKTQISRPTRRHGNGKSIRFNHQRVGSSTSTIKSDTLLRHRSTIYSSSSDHHSLSKLRDSRHSQSQFSDEKTKARSASAPNERGGRKRSKGRGKSNSAKKD